MQHDERDKGRSLKHIQRDNRVPILDGKKRRIQQKKNQDVVREIRGEIEEQFVIEARDRDDFTEKGVINIVKLLRDGPR